MIGEPHPIPRKDLPNRLQAVSGMHDMLPLECAHWQQLEQKAIEIIQAYGYQQIRFPIVEKEALFTRSIGNVTDIVSKEMYSFQDRNGDLLTLRPEGTAGCVRAGLQHGLFYNQTQKLWYIGPMFRHERQQKGRYRQFHQIGVEAFGFHGPDVDAEMLILCARLWRALGIADKVKLQINTLGNQQTRQLYRVALLDYLHDKPLDEQSKRRLRDNPLRILDSKIPEIQALLKSAPDINDYIDKESKEHFSGLRKILDTVSLPYEVNRQLVRGLDYYCKTVFEWVSDELGAQATICGGGRYDSLVEQLGGKQATPACGFSMGLERIISLLPTDGTIREIPHIYMLLIGDQAIATGFQLAESLRNQLPGLRLSTHLGHGNYKKQLKQADKSGAEYAMILEDEGIKNQYILFKPLRLQAKQEKISWDQLVMLLANKLEA